VPIHLTMTLHALLYRSPLDLARTAAGGVSLLAAPALLGAQARIASVGPLYVQPVGGLSHYVSPGWGGSGAVTWLGRSSPLGLRFEVSYVSFPFAPADHADLRTTAQVPVLVSTGGSRLALSAGPVLAFPLGPVRASLNAGVGATGAFTTMSLTGLGSDDRYSRPKRFSDLAPVFQVGVGAGVRLARGVQVELAAAFGAVGPTSYGLGDRIRVGVISGPYWGPRRQWSEFASYRLAVVFGQRR
jgi:hypothetical protein